MQSVTSKQWVEKGIKLFGPIRTDWQFVCPGCGNIQTAKDFIRLKKDGMAPSATFLTCATQFQKEPKSCSFDATRDTHETLIAVINEKGKVIPTFPFNFPKKRCA